jgi:S-DNA-T family DNA segregation ATPase FtsK/SpoIIIE
MRELLDYQADQIERVLASHGVPGRVYGGAVSSRLVEFHVAPAPGVKIARIEALAEELAMYLGVGACRVQRRGAVISIEVPKERPPLVKLLPLLASLGNKLPAGSAMLGQDNEGMPILLRLPSPDVAHVLITGTTGSGKTELAKSMILSLAVCNRPDALRLLLIDPKGRGYRVFAGLPHLVCPIVSDVGEAHNRLSGLVDEMERRDKAGECEPQIVVFVDELADLMMVGGKQMIYIMTRLTQRGREAGIHLVACTQKPTAAIVGGLVKSNFPARLIGSVASADDARIAAGISGSGAERLSGRGDFLLVVKGDVRRLQAAYVPPEELSVAVSQVASIPTSIAPSLPARSSTPSDGVATGDRAGSPGVSQKTIPDEAASSPTRGDDPDTRPNPPTAPAPRSSAESSPAAAPDETPATGGGALETAATAFSWRPYNAYLSVGSRRG